MTTLGQAYVQIMPSAKGISGSIQKTLNPEATAAGRSAGSNIASAMSESMSKAGSKLTKSITLPVAGAMTAVTGLVTALGFKRLIGMDNARAKLEGMGYAGKNLENVMNDAREAVTGTTMTMAEGVDIAAGALAAGVEQGAELEHYIKLVGSAAVGANRPVDEMAQIFNRVQGGGRLMTQELNMIEMGLPGFAQTMANELSGGSMEAFRDMVTNGEVGSQDFLKVMDGFAGGMADAYAGTWSGMAKNVLSNIGIIGEALIGGLFEDGKQGMAEFLDVLRSDGLREWARDTGVTIRELAHTVIDGAKQMMDWWNQLSPVTQEIAKKIAIFGTIGAVSIGPLLKVVAPLVSAIGALIPVFAALFSPVGLIIGAITALTAGIVYLWNTNEEFREFLGEIWESISEIFTSVISAIVEFVQEIWGGLVEWWQEHNEMIMQAFENFVNFILGLMEFLWPFVEMLVVQTWQAVQDIIQGAIDVITGIIEFFSALFTGDWEALWEATKKILSGAVQALWGLVNTWFIGRILKLGSTFIKSFRDVFSKGWDFIKNLFTSSVNAVRNAVSTGFNAVRNVVS